MQKISNIQELEAERERLLMRKVHLEGEIKNSFNELKEDLQPLNAFRKGVSGFLSSKNNDVLSGSIGGVVEYLLRNLVFRRSGLLTRLIVPYLAKNATANAVSQNKSTIMKTIIGIFSKLSAEKEEATGQTEA